MFHGSWKFVESGWYRLAVRVHRCVGYNGCINCGTKTMEGIVAGR